MAIPKEPRQLMINIMYLVLTALLALNVSAEIFNAFKMVDKGLVESNKALDAQIEAVQQSVEEGSKKKAGWAQPDRRSDVVQGFLCVLVTSVGRRPHLRRAAAAASPR